MKLYVYKNILTGELQFSDREWNVMRTDSDKLIGTITLDAPEEAPKAEPIVRYTAVYNNFIDTKFIHLDDVIKYSKDARYIVKHTYYPDDPRKNTSEVIAYE